MKIKFISKFELLLRAVPTLVAVVTVPTVKTVKRYSSLEEESSQSYGASLTVWYHTVLPAIRHKMNAPRLTQPDRLVLDLPTSEGWKAAFA